jgi:hypothetical protein
MSYCDFAIRRSFLLLAFILSLTNSSLTQIALDRPMTVETGDKVFLSVNDPKVAYVFPYALIIKAKPRVTTSKKVVTIHFTAGVDADYISSVQSAVTKVAPGVSVHLIRGLNSSVLPHSVTDVGSEFEPMLIVLGEAADFGHDTEYALILRRRRSWFTNLTSRVIEETFNAVSPRNVGVIGYSFAATNGGQPYLGNTAIPLFVVRK